MAQNKSQAEAVNFGNAVATKAYEKKAALVDTFVRSESAEQKLARSGKLQTAKALEAIASLGGSAVKGKAMQLEEKARKQQESLATTTAQAIEDIEQGRIQHLTESQDYADLPVYLQIQLAQDVGKQEATKAFQQIQKDYDAAGTLHSDDTAYLELRNSQFAATDAEDGVSLHRQMARNTALEGFLGQLDVQNNKYKSAENLEKLGRAFGNSINDMVLAGKGSESSGVEIWSNIVELDKRLAATSGLTNGQRKKIISERVMALALSTDDLELLNPANIPDLFQDPATLNKYADVKQTLEKKVKSDRIAELNLQAAERKAETFKAIDDAHSGVLETRVKEEGFNSLSRFEQEALIVHRNKATIDNKQSKLNYENTKELIELSAIADSEFLTDKNGNVINDINGNPVEMNPESLRAYLKSTGDINPNETTTLIGEVDTIMQLQGLEEKFKPVGNYISNLLKQKLKMGSVYPDRTEAKILSRARSFYRKKMAELLTANEGKPLSFDQKDDLQSLTEDYAEELATKFDYKGDVKRNNEGQVSVDGILTTLTPEFISSLPEKDQNAYAQISAMPEGAEKSNLLAKFNQMHTPKAVNNEAKDSSLDNITDRITTVAEKLAEDYSDDDSPIGKLGKERFEEEKAELEAQLESLQQRLLETQSMSEVEILTDRLRAVEAQTKPKGALRLKMRNEKIAKLKQRLAEAEARESE